VDEAFIEEVIGGLNSEFGFILVVRGFAQHVVITLLTVLPYDKGSGVYALN
jgi:hypothetical protein